MLNLNGQMIKNGGVIFNLFCSLFLQKRTQFFTQWIFFLTHFTLSIEIGMVENMRFKVRFRLEQNFILRLCDLVSHKRIFYKVTHKSLVSCHVIGLAKHPHSQPLEVFEKPIHFLICK